MPGNFRSKGSPEKLKSVSKVILLVHPLYALWHSGLLEHGEDHLRLSSPFPKPNIRFLLGLWGKELKEVSSDPNSIAIIVTNPPSLRGDETAVKINHTMDRFTRFAARVLGSRVFFYSGVVDHDHLRSEIAKRGYRLARNWSGRAFGENLKRCVHNEIAALNWKTKKWYDLGKHSRWVDRQMQLGRIPVKAVPEKSLVALNYDADEVAMYRELNPFTLGSMRDNLRKNASKIRKRARAHVRRSHG